MSSSCASSVPSTTCTTRAAHNHEMHPKPIQSFTSPTPFGTLIIIPVELRLKVYSALIERGQVAILRTSQAIHEEALDNYYKYAVCRLKSDFFTPLKADPGQVPWKTIQNLEVQIEMTHLDNFCFDEWMQCFSTNRADLKTCKIRLENNHRFMSSIPEALMAIKTPVAFQRVVLVIAMVNQDLVTVMKDFATSVREDPDRYMYVGVHENRGMGWLAYDWAVGFLEPSLGGSVWFEGDGSVHLEFYPQRSALLASSEDKDAKIEEED